MFDNIDDRSPGVIYLCEDPAIAATTARSGPTTPRPARFATIMKFDPAKFGDVVDKTYTAPTAPFVDDKETSGVIDATDLFADAAWFKAGSKALLAVAQAHFKYDGSDKVGAELVEGGQLLLLVKAP